MPAAPPKGDQEPVPGCRYLRLLRVSAKYPMGLPGRARGHDREATPPIQALLAREFFLKDCFGEEGQQGKRRLGAEVIRFHPGPAEGVAIVRNLPRAQRQLAEPPGSQVGKMLG
jgi:hypothetical protein